MIVKHLMSHARLAAASLALLTAHIGPASAFTVDLSALTDAAEPGTHYIPTLSFALDAPLVPYRAEVSLTPALPRKLGMFSLMAEETYNAEQATQFPDWTFTLKDQSQLGGTLTVDRYQARRGRIASEGVGNAAGASLHMTYTRAATDPANLTWLQVYRENTDGGGPDAWHVDPFPNDDGGEKLPFYFRDNEGGESLAAAFSDRPGDDITSKHFYRIVDFQVYLVSYDPAQVNDGTQGGEFTIYGGINWGYQIVVPEPGMAWLLGSALACLPVFRRRAGAARQADMP